MYGFMSPHELGAFFVLNTETRRHRVFKEKMKTPCLCVSVFNEFPLHKNNNQ